MSHHVAEKFKDALSIKAVDSNIQKRLLAETPTDVMARLLDSGELEKPKEVKEYISKVKALEENNDKAEHAAQYEELLLSIFVSLKSTSSEWFACFMNNGGPEALIPLLTRLGSNVYKTDVEWRQQHLLLSCLRLMMTTPEVCSNVSLSLIVVVSHTCSNGV